jgi:hypothetical protein
MRASKGRATDAVSARQRQRETLALSWWRELYAQVFGEPFAPSVVEE